MGGISNSGPGISGGVRVEDDVTDYLAIGTRLHEFEVRGLIGHGGFSYVYLAKDHSLQRTVALKEYMPASLAIRLSDRSVAARTEHAKATFDAGLRSFVNEARLLAQFDHAALVKVYRFWEGNGTAYMAMPYYEGTTLKQTIDSNLHVVDESWLKRILAPIVDALEVLHRANCYHRDISPDNILLLNGGAPLLLDFGAARRIVGGIRMTQGVTVIVKPGYAPLEQYSGEANSLQGPWTDIYALSAVLYFAITGKAPAPSVVRTLSDSLTTLQPRVAQGYSAGFLAAIERGLAVEPAARPQSMAKFRSMLELSPAQGNVHYDRVPATNLDSSGARLSDSPREAPFVDAGRDQPATLVSEPPLSVASDHISQSPPEAAGSQVALRHHLRYSLAIALTLFLSGGAAYLWLGRSSTSDHRAPTESPSARMQKPPEAPGAPETPQAGRHGNAASETVPGGPPTEPIASPVANPANSGPTDEQVDATLELEAWQAVQRDETRDAYTRFLTQFPDGRYAAAAKARLLKLPDAISSAQRTTPARTSIPDTAKPGRRLPTAAGTSGAPDAAGVSRATGTSVEPTREQGVQRELPAPTVIPEDQKSQEMERYKRQIEQLQAEKEEATRQREREEATRQREREEATSQREREEAMKKQPAKNVEVPESTKKKTPAPFVPSY